MTLGPPPSAAGPSGSTPPMQGLETPTNAQTNAHATAAPASSPTAPVPGPSVSTGPYTSQFSVQPQQAAHPYYAHSGTTTYAPGYASNMRHPGPPQQGSQHPTGAHYPPHTNYQPPQHAQTQGAPQAATGTYSYYNYPTNAWANAWNAGTYQYSSGSSYPYSYAQPQTPQRAAPTAVAPTPQPKHAPSPPPPPKRKTPTPSPSPPPLPEYHKDWDAIIKSFLSAIGFSQAVRGFEADMLIMNPEYERKKVPVALGELMKDLLKLGQGKPETDANDVPERPLEERKLDHVHLVNGATPRSQTSITKDISRFLAQNRARNDASNRNEFLLSLAEKRRRLNENGDSTSSESIPSCARTDAKTQNRDLQMKYDIAKNEDGPLRRTLKSGAPTTAEPAPSTSKLGANGAAEDVPSAHRYPDLDERLQNVEKHLAIRYVPSPPRSLLDRLKYLEDHIIHLEKEYPPWAALHFNQPNRGWPPPPRPTPIIVPSHLTSTAARDPAEPPRAIAASGSSATPSGHATPTTEATDASAKGKAKPGRHTKSSLHRAVMERLEVQKAINDLTGDAG